MPRVLPPPHCDNHQFLQTLSNVPWGHISPAENSCPACWAVGHGACSGVERTRASPDRKRKSPGPGHSLTEKLRTGPRRLNAAFLTQRVRLLCARGHHRCSQQSSRFPALSVFTVLAQKIFVPRGQE